MCVARRPRRLVVVYHSSRWYCAKCHQSVYERHSIVYRERGIMRVRCPMCGVCLGGRLLAPARARPSARAGWLPV